MPPWCQRVRSRSRDRLQPVPERYCPNSQPFGVYHAALQMIPKTLMQVAAEGQCDSTCLRVTRYATKETGHACAMRQSVLREAGLSAREIAAASPLLAGA